MNFKEYLESVETTTAQALVLVHMAETVEVLSEEVVSEAVTDSLKKIGLSAHKSRSLFDYFKSFSTGVGKLFLYLIRGDTKKAREVLQTVDRADVVDFIMKLDAGTLHLISAPLHTIDAWTGWHIGSNVKKKLDQGKSIAAVIRDSIAKVKQSIQRLYADNIPHQNKLMKHAINLEKNIII